MLNNQGKIYTFVFSSQMLYIINSRKGRDMMTKKKKLRILLTLLIIVWMGVIFCFSNQTGPKSSSSSQSVIHLIGQISKTVTGHNIVNTLSTDAFSFLEFIIRKCAHMFVYFILSILTMLLMFTYENYPLRFKSFISLLVSFLYACSDELHQFFVGGRSASFRDVMIDSTGACIGILLTLIIYTLIKKGTASLLAVSFIWLEFYIVIRIFICIMPPFTLVSYKTILLHCFF